MESNNMEVSGRTWKHSSFCETKEKAGCKQAAVVLNKTLRQHNDSEYKHTSRH